MSLLVDDRYVVISQGPVPLFRRIIAAVLLTGFVFCVYAMVREYLEEGWINALYFYGSFFLLMYGFQAARSRNFVFHFKKHRFREEVQLGFLKFGFWEPLPDLKYVSVYKVAPKIYIIKIFITVNDGYEIVGFKNADDGILAAKAIAKKLSIDCWNATNPGNGDWLEID
ncbi:hypothetical protein [Patiriisocius marinus]|uniref:Photosystem I assembly protein Ycf4 n=1 Tax=Patiriisocius marinus TaxID=1397112 RepID=A0A5J4IR51_9FLAO|nr:hypothetical protein [Patiriisocius marinus]GER60309.1 hypothetical protein ULMA_24170 [Patiriisocius marinus]